ncbi:glycosyltransferase family 4 protein [Rhabdobacter roseus]|uniref:Glycosyltransferase involved in cell wall biosynthesis n=1 Tax=Rhabdobacter roseus TaxID=1655419 RepID=A0A840TTW7_9BACT|nr:glycosyltransferase family 4 protein [Rhabdobacter roseus]MBB5283488.1 glycosyltransferase involved in cell wall biosynthesis [Rhabdobacter roseus]
MRVLLIHNQLWAHYKSKLFSEIHRALREKYPDSQFQVAHIALYEASRKAMMKSQEEPIYKYPYTVLFETSLDEVPFAKRLKALFRTYRSFRPTVLNITGYYDWAQVLLMLYARSQGVRVILTVESSSLDHKRSWLKEKLKSWIVNNANAYFCFGQTSVAYLKSLGVPEAKIAVSHAAVIDETIIRENYQRALAEKASTPLARRHFIYVGRLAPEKNLVALLDAFRKTQQQNPPSAEWGLLLVGDGASRAELEKYVQEKKIPRVRFTGGCAWYEVPGWLAQASVLVLPSLSEPWGLVVNEAMVCGLPVIVSDRCGCAPDLVEEGLNGFLFSPDHPADLATSMQYFIQNPEKISAMGVESRRLVASFSSERVAQQMVACYHSLANH